VRWRKVWLKEHNEFFKDIVIDQAKLDQLPEDASVEEEMLDANWIPLDCDRGPCHTPAEGST